MEAPYWSSSIFLALGELWADPNLCGWRCLERQCHGNHLLVDDQ